MKEVGNDYLCWECNKENHSIDCGSKSRVDALDWFINSLHSVPEEVLDTISHKIHVEIMERNNPDTLKED